MHFDPNATTAQLDVDLVEAPRLLDEALKALLDDHAQAQAPRLISPHELRAPYLPDTRFLAAPAVSGRPVFLILDSEGAFLCDEAGRITSGLPALEGLRAGRRAVLTGVLSYERGGRHDHEALTRLLEEGEGDKAALSFTAFDLLERDDLTYPSRLAIARGLLGARPMARVVATQEVSSPEEIQQLYLEQVEGLGAEGLVLRSGAQRYVIKPSLTLNVVIMGYTLRAGDREAIDALCLGLERGEGLYQIVGGCQRMSATRRKALYAQLAPLAVTADFHQAGPSGAVYQMVRPEIRAQLRARDVSVERARLAAEASQEGPWQSAGLMPSVRLSGPTFVRICEGGAAAGFEQLNAKLRARLEARPQPTLPKSEVLRREVYAKTLGGKRAVRKLLMWRTNKDKLDPTYPAFVVHFTDYSPQRKEPLTRVVRLASTLQDAQRECGRLLDEHIKSDWARQDGEEEAFRLEA